MITATAALETLLERVQSPVQSEVVGLSALGQRVLAEDVIAPLDLPEFDNSAMDGYALAMADVQTVPQELRIVAEIAAETIAQVGLKPGECARIFTGGVLPQGADTIVRQEDTERSGDRVTILKQPNLGDFVRRQGEYCPKGGILLTKGTPIGSPEIGILAAVQCLQVPVFTKPIGAIISTGSELIPPEAERAPGQIVDSNQYVLGSLISQTGAIPLYLGIIPDRLELLERQLLEALVKADLIFTIGGASVGEYDYLGKALANLGAEIHYRSVAMKPGKPVTVASLQGKVIIGLPGNPASALVGYWRLGQFAIKKLMGYKNCQPLMFHVPTLADLKGTPKRENYIWGKLVVNGGILSFQPNSGSQNSGNLVGLAHTNALGVVPPDTTIGRGSLVEVLSP